MKKYKELTVTFTAELTKVFKDVSEEDVAFMLANGARDTQIYFKENCEFDNAQVKDYKVFVGTDK